jgi:uncharacterized protein involved in outer membrane biogenesis
MRLSLRILTFLTLTLLITTVIVFLKMNTWIARAAEDYVYKKTEFSLQIGSVETDVFRGIVELRDITLKNPNQFPNPDFFQINSLRLHWVWGSLFSNCIHFREVVADISEFSGVRNRAGDINVKTFANAFLINDSKKIDQTTSNQEESTEKEFFIDRLFFQLEKVTIADFYENKHDVKTTRVGIRRVFNNVSNYSQVAIPLTADLSIFVTGFILDSILKSSVDKKTYLEIAPNLVAPLKNTLEKTKRDVKKTLDKLLKEIPSTGDYPQSHETTPSVSE